VAFFLDKKVRVIIVFLFLLISPVFSKVEYKTYELRTQKFSFQDVCLKMGKPHSIMASAYNHVWVNCMNTKVSAQQFCLKHFVPSKGEFLRGVILDNTVICSEGMAARVSMECPDRSCQNKKISCLKLKKFFAYDLSLLSSSLSYSKRGWQKINCHFSQNEKLEPKLNSLLL